MSVSDAASGNIANDDTIGRAPDTLVEDGITDPMLSH